jgi:hypothetical protein
MQRIFEERRVAKEEAAAAEAAASAAQRAERDTRRRLAEHSIEMPPLKLRMPHDMGAAVRHNIDSCPICRCAQLIWLY